MSERKTPGTHHPPPPLLTLANRSQTSTDRPLRSPPYPERRYSTPLSSPLTPTTQHSKPYHPGGREAHQRQTPSAEGPTVPSNHIATNHRHQYPPPSPITHSAVQHAPPCPIRAPSKTLSAGYDVDEPATMQHTKAFPPESIHLNRPLSDQCGSRSSTDIGRRRCRQHRDKTDTAWAQPQSSTITCRNS